MAYTEGLDNPTCRSLTKYSRTDILIDREVGMHVNAPLLTYLAPNRGGIALYSEMKVMSPLKGYSVFFYTNGGQYGRG
jgi:hypothetical protein